MNFRKRNVVSALVLFVMIIMLCSAGQAAEEQVKLSYEVFIHPGEPGRVEARLEGLSSSSVEFNMPTVDQTNLKQNVSNFSAAGADGEALSVSSGSSGWTVSANGNNVITVTYEFGLQFNQPSGRNWKFVEVDERYGLFYNMAVFAFPELELKEVFVQFNLPEGWGAATPFTALANNRFQVDGVPGFREELLNNTTRIGKISYQIDKHYDDLSLSFFVFQLPVVNYGLNEFWRNYYSKTPELEMENYLDMTYEVIQHLTKIFGYWPGGNNYIVTTRSEGDELHSLAGFKYWIPAWTRERSPDVHHHIAHAWIWRDDISLKEGEGDWLMEGVPTYYQAELPYRMENDDMWLGLHYLHYLVTERAAQFKLMNKVTINQYAQNHMRVLALDQAIKEATGGRKDLEDLLYYIGQEYGKQGKPMNNASMLSAINHITESDLSGYYSRHLTGKIAREKPPVDEFIDQYEEPFLKWLGTYAEIPGYMTGGSKTMLLIALEMGIHSTDAHYNEHMIAGRANPHSLWDFHSVLKKYEQPFTETEVIKTLEELTGVSQSDFFDFYTFGGYSPSVEEITEWFNNPSDDESMYKAAIGDRSIAYLEPSVVEIGVPTELKLVVKDLDLISSKSRTRVSVTLHGEENLGTVLHDLKFHTVVDNYVVNGRTRYFEAGELPGEFIDDYWEGTFTVTIPEDFVVMQIQADFSSDYHHNLALFTVEPGTTEDMVDGEEEVVEELVQSEQKSSIFSPTIAAAIILPIFGAGAYLLKRRKTSQ